MSKLITDFKFKDLKINSKADTNKKNLQDNFKRLTAIKFNIITLKSKVLSETTKNKFQSITMLLKIIIKIHIQKKFNKGNEWKNYQYSIESNTFTYRLLVKKFIFRQLIK